MIPSTPRRSPVYTGNGVVSSFAFEFKVFAASDVEVSRVDLLGNTTVLTLGADYTVTLNPDQDNFPGGTVNTTVPLASGFKLVATGNLPYQQSTQLPNGGNYNARVVEQALDKVVVQVQQLKEASDRTLRLSVGVDGVSSALPAPVPLSVIGWDSTGLLLRNFTPGDIGVNVSYAQWQTQLFNGTGVQTAFVLTEDAGSANNIDLRVNSVPQTPGVNFTYTQPTRTITFLTGAPAAGTNNVVARYGQALPQGTFALADNSVAGAKLVDGAVATAKLADGAVSTVKLADDAVTFTKLQNVATARLLGRAAAGSGDVEELTPAQVATILPIPGFGNLLINGNFLINQRAYVSGTATSGANQYTLDRWRVVTSGQNLTFSASGNGNQITAPAGGVEQVIEGGNIEGGTYVLNWTGTATATVNGTARTKGETFTLPANTNATVRFIGGTVSKAQLELGSTPTSFQNRQIAEELALCQRYYVAMTGLLKTQYAASTLTTNIASVEFPVTMRASPTIAFANVGYTNGSGLSAGTTTPFAARLAATISSGGNMLVAFDMFATAEL